MRVLLISANTEKLPDPVFPLGAAYIAAVSAEHGHAVDTLDLCFLDALRPALDDKIRIQVLQKLRERKIKGQLWRLLR